VIPTFNDSAEEIRAIAEFARSLGTVKEMHLLPYHRIGSDKYAGLGRPYTMAHIVPPPKEQMQLLLEVVNAVGIRGQIGG
jgi:pyruvate formate lyase activating enzyme